MKKTLGLMALSLAFSAVAGGQRAGADAICASA